MKFNYGGCGGNDNNFETLEKCQRKCGDKGKAPIGVPLHLHADGDRFYNHLCRNLRLTGVELWPVNTLPEDQWSF